MNMSIHWSHRNLIFSHFIAGKFWLYFSMIYEYVWCHKIADSCPLSLIFHSNEFQVAYSYEFSWIWKFFVWISSQFSWETSGYFDISLKDWQLSQLIHSSHILQIMIVTFNHDDKLYRYKIWHIHWIFFFGNKVNLHHSNQWNQKSTQIAWFLWWKVILFAKQLPTHE